MTKPPDWGTSTATANRRELRVPVDLVAVVGFVALSAQLLVGWAPASPVVRALFGLPLLFLTPGYAVVSALFPRSRASGTTSDSDRLGTESRTGVASEGPTDAERLALSFGLSFALLPLLGLAIASVRGFTSSAVVLTVSGFVVVVTVLAAVRRKRVPASERYSVGAADRVARFLSWLHPGGSPLEAVVNAALVGSVLLALLTGGYAFVAPQDGEKYTTLQLLTENDSGELVAAGYPERIDAGGEIPLTVAVGNREGESRSYTLVVQQQRVVDGQVVEREELRRLDYRVRRGSTAYDDRTFEPTAGAGEIRLTFLLYEGTDVPDEPTTGNAYRYAHLWVDVEMADE